MMARLAGELVVRSSADRASRLMRGRVAIVIEDMLVVVVVLVEGVDLNGRKQQAKSKIAKGVTGCCLQRNKDRKSRTSRDAEDSDI